jgi:serine protease Do
VDNAAVHLLKQLNSSLETLVTKVSSAVVEVLVTGFGPAEESAENRTALVGRQSKRGSGVIVDPDGYIITNAHVVAGARSIEVIVTSRSQDIEDRGRTSYTAHLVGVHKDPDLALIKIDATALSVYLVRERRERGAGFRDPFQSREFRFLSPGSCPRVLPSKPEMSHL